MRKIIFVVSALFVGTIVGMILCGMRINLTGSMPVGIYKLSRDQSLHHDDLIAVCLPKSLAQHGLKNGYLMSGGCGDSNTMPVLKQLIAMPGDIVEVGLKSILVNVKTYPAKIQTHDGLGHPLKIHSQLGVKMMVNNYWIYGSASERSWDSRYYGGVERSDIIGVYKPFLVF